MSALSVYNFHIIYKPGSKNTDADIMSRYPFDQIKTEGECKIEECTIKTICQLANSIPYNIHLPIVSLNMLDVIGDSG